MSIRYSQNFKDSLVKLHQEGRSLKSLAEVFGPSKDSIALWVKQLENRLAILEEENEILKRAAILLAKK
ncbi:transposase [Pediococcus pentosaceus]|uniref:transposase n=1 Tax=Pediococcus pentosaceus TaxID=1255 RepID=UPI002DEDE3AB|nr:transposase [Pediococcus pentosaceus]MEC5141739.1 transposase [Pediococcus pentosaceus]